MNNLAMNNLAMNSTKEHFNLGIVIPTYNHFKALQKVLCDINSFQLPVIVIDDASTDGLSSQAENLKAQYPNLVYVCHPHNQGKGAAVKTGVKVAKELGLSHVLTMHADGQHCISGIEQLINAATSNSGTCIFGKPIFSGNVPIVRRLGREISNILCWLFTLSFTVRDVLCGARIYPLKLTESTITEKTKSQRMDFDPEIAIRLVQSKVPIINVAINVDYPADGLSHFHYLKDNLLIAKMNIAIFIETLFTKR